MAAPRSGYGVVVKPRETHTGMWLSGQCSDAPTQMRLGRAGPD